MKTTVLVPVFSETESLMETVSRLKTCLTGVDYEILIVASPFSKEPCLNLCAELADKEPNVRFVLQSNVSGQGQAFREAAPRATGSHLVFMCSDLESHPETVADLIQHIQESSSDVVVASRWHRESRFEGYGFFKLILNKIFQSVFKRLYRTGVSDLTFVFKIMRREVFEKFDWQGTGHEFALETTLRPIRAGYRVDQIPTIWKSRREGRSHWGFHKNLRHLKMACSIFLYGDRA